MGIQPSASHTDLLVACPRPFEVEIETEDEPGEANRYGSAFHVVVATALRRRGKKPFEATDAYEREVDRAATAFDVRAAGIELAAHAKSSLKVLRNWLSREKLEITAIEEAFAVKPSRDGQWTSRAIPPHDDDHRYYVNPGEIPGTIDLIAVGGKRRVVLDHKTGWVDEDFARPSKIPQMKTLGLIMPGGAEVEVAIFHADRKGLPALYCEEYSKADRRSHAAELYAALKRVGDGFLRPGKQCRYCPARATCPAYAADLLAEGSAALVAGANKLAVEPITGLLAPATGASIEERAGALYLILKKFRALDKAGSDEIRRRVKAGAIVELPTGEVLTIRTQTYETLSKKSVVEALGAVDGERELARLRKKGAIREVTREMLIPEKMR